MREKQSKNQWPNFPFLIRGNSRATVNSCPSFSKINSKGREKMAFNLRFEENGNYYVLSFTEDTDEYNYRKSALVLSQELGKSEGQKVLIDSRKAPVKLEGIEYFDFIQFATSKMPPMTKIAILVNPFREVKARVAPLLATRSKVELKIFLEPDSAIDWLLV